MSRRQIFNLQAPVSGELMRLQPDQTRVHVIETLGYALDVLTGPRGGKYKAVSAIYDLQESHDERDLVMFTGHVVGEYVRP